MLSFIQNVDVVGLRTRQVTAFVPSAPTTQSSAPVPFVVPKVAEVQPIPDTRRRIMLCGTYPIGQSNGYSRVVYYIAKYLGQKMDIRLTIYGFQNYKQTAGSDQRNEIPPYVILHDALATENPTRSGFGEAEITTYLKANPQDMVIIFNDMVVTTALVQNIVKGGMRDKIRLVSYMDQVYPYQKKQYIDMLNDHFDAVVTFTPYWRTTVRKLGLKNEIPCYVFPHGFDHQLYYPIPRKLARAQYNIPHDAFAILNLNRNQPRKRWDHTIIAFADVISRYYQRCKERPNEAHRPIILMVGTAIAGYWDLTELYQHELKLRDVPWEFGSRCMVGLMNPQQLSDKDINVLYNACDIGLNTCEGEGWGLCQSEHAAVGCPQVAPRIGGMQEFLNDDNSIPIHAKWRYYIDKQRDGIGGIAEIADTTEYADAIWKYYNDTALMERHGKESRRQILTHFRWETVVNHFHRVLQDILASTKTPACL